MGQIMALAMLVGQAATAYTSTTQAAVRRPVMKFEGGADKLTALANRLEGKDAAALAKAYRDETGDWRMMALNYEESAKAAATLWIAHKQEKYRDLALAAYGTALGDLAAAGDDELRRRVSDKGGIDPEIFVLRNACYHFAMQYAVTRDQAHASKAAVILGRFAEQLPKWPLYVPYHTKEQTPFGQDDPKAQENEFCSGPWGAWLHQDLARGLPLAEAYDLIYDSGEMQRRGILPAVEAMLERQVNLQFRFVLFSNMDGYQLWNVVQFAHLLGRPEWIHKCVWWLRGVYKTQFYADGWWHEGTPSYHFGSQHWLARVAREKLQGYSDPPGFVSKLDGARFDNLDLLKLVGRAVERGDQVLNDVTQPNAIYQVIHDTQFPHYAQHNWAPQEGKAALFGCMGHAILATGKGKDNIVQASLHFGGTHGHTHYDCLNLILFAKGRELISETQYQPGRVTNTTREWHTVTPAHVTVVVDEGGQGHCPKRTRQPEDDVPGYPDWPWRWVSHGCNMNDGRLRIFNTDFENVQVAEADGERVYAALAEKGMYRRTIALVKIGDADCYVVDIFRVRGGKTHDYMLHGCLDSPHSLALSVPLTGKREGDLYKYITDLHTAAVDQAWEATFTLDDKSAAMKTFFMGAGGTQIIQGSAPAMRREGTAPFLAIRRSGGDSVFVAVHHPYVGQPVVQKVEAVPLLGDQAGGVALRVTLPDRVDTIFSSADDEPRTAMKTADAKTSIKARFAHLAEGKGTNRWAYMIDGRSLKAGDLSIRGQTSHEGAIRRTIRREAGDPTDAFVVGASLPTDGSLAGHTMMVDLGGLLVQSFGIKSVRREADQTVIESAGEPGMTVTPGLVKLEYFPNWGIRGQAKFRVSGSALLRGDASGAWRLTATGEVVAAVGDRAIARSAGTAGD